MTELPATAPRLEIGRVIQLAVAQLGRRWAPMTLLALLLAGLPAALVDALVILLDPEGAAAYVARLTTLGSTVGGLVGVLAQGAIIDMTVRDLDGRPVGVRRSLGVSTRIFLPMLGLSIWANLGILLGLVLLIVPGVYLAIIWSLVLPVCVHEPNRTASAFDRSGALVRENRWRVLAVLLIGTVVFLVTLLVLGFVAGLAVPAAMESPLGQIVLGGLISALTTLMLSLGAGVLYAELKRLKEGSASLAEVFA